LKKFLFLCIFFSGSVHSQSIFTLNCVESTDSNNQFIVSVDEAKKRVFFGNSNFLNVFISKEIIKFDTTDGKGFYTTEITRSTGHFRTNYNQKYVFGGYCTKVISNKF
jgi:hypothetical protein